MMLDLPSRLASKLSELVMIVLVLLPHCYSQNTAALKKKLKNLKNNKAKLTALQEKIKALSSR